MDTKELLDAVGKIEDELLKGMGPWHEDYHLLQATIREKALEILSELVSAVQREQAIATLAGELGSNVRSSGLTEDSEETKKRVARKGWHIT